MYTHNMEDFLEKELERSEKISTIWKALQTREIDSSIVPSSDKSFYVERIQKLMFDEQEKWRDSEGKEFYKRVTSFIEKLNS